MTSLANISKNTPSLKSSTKGLTEYLVTEALDFLIQESGERILASVTDMNIGVISKNATSLSNSSK